MLVEKRKKRDPESSGNGNMEETVKGAVEVAAIVPSSPLATTVFHLLIQPQLQSC